MYYREHPIHRRWSELLSQTSLKHILTRRDAFLMTQPIWFCSYLPPASLLGLAYSANSGLISKAITMRKVLQSFILAVKPRFFVRTEYEKEPSLKANTARAVLATKNVCPTLLDFGAIIYTSALRLPRSLHDVSRANNNRFAVVVYFNSALRASEMPKNWKFLIFKFFSNFVPS